MALQDALDAAVAVLRRRPGDLLPVYLLTPALPAIARAVAAVGVAAAYLQLSATGRLTDARTALAGRDLNPPSPETDPEAFQAWAESVAPALEPLADPVAIAALVVAVLVSVLVLVLVYAAAGAAQASACYGRLRSERGLTAAVEGVRRYWLTFLGLLVLEAVLLVGATGILALGAGFVVDTAGAAVGALVVLVGVLAWFATVVVVRSLFAFAPAAVVVDDAGVVGSLRGSGGYISRNLAEAAGYIFLALGAVGGLAVLTAALSAVGGTQVLAIVGFALVSPLVDLVKVGLYGDYRGRTSPPSSPESTVRDQALAGVRRGWTEFTAFVRDYPGLQVAALALIGGGFAAGWYAAAPYEGMVSTSIDARLETFITPTAAVDIAGNNINVALSAALAGVAAAFPAAVVLLTNGLVLGVYAQLEVAPLELLAFVVPHGVIELSAIGVAGALGLFVGVRALRTARGRATRTDLADGLERGFWVLVGVALALVVAALIETYVSPYYYRPFVAGLAVV